MTLVVGSVGVDWEVGWGVVGLVEALAVGLVGAVRVVAPVVDLGEVAMVEAKEVVRVEVVKVAALEEGVGGM